MEVIFKIEDKPFAGGFSDERLKSKCFAGEET